MKRLIVLAIVGLFLAATAMAGDTTITGEVEMRWLNDFNNKTFTEGNIVELEFTATVDDYNEAYVELEEGASGVGEGVDLLDKAFFTTDIGGIFGLPVGLTLRTGHDEYDLFDAVKVTDGEFEDIIGSDWQAWGHEVNVKVQDMVAIRALWANDPGMEAFSVGLAVTYDPIYIEAGYVAAKANEDANPAYSNGDALSTGDIEVGAEFTMDVADGIGVAAAAALDYDLNEETLDESQYAASAALAVTYMDMVKLSFAWVGVQDFMAGAMQIDATISAVEGLTVYLFTGLGLDSDAYAETFDSFEGSAKFGLGKSTWYAGLYWQADGGVGIASEKADFGPEASDSMGIFMRAEVLW